MNATSEYRTTAKQLLANLVVFLMLANVVWAGFFVVYGEVEYYFWALLIPFALFYCIRRWVKGILPFILLHVLVSVGAVFFLADEYMWHFVLGFVIVGGIWSFIVRTRRAQGLNRFFPVVLLHIALFLFLDILSVDAESAQVMIVVNFVVVGAFIIHTHMDNVDYRLKVLRSVEQYNQPAQRVLAFNNKMIVVYVAGLVVVGFVGAVFPVGRALTRAVGWLLWPLRRQLGNVPGAIQYVPTPEFELTRPDWEIPPDAEYVIYHGRGLLEIMAEHRVELDAMPFFYSEMLLLWAAALAFLALMLYFFYKRFFQRKKGRALGKNADETEALHGSFFSDLRAFLPRRKKHSRNAIRRAYAKKVNRHIKDGVKIEASDTTEIIAEKIRPFDDIDELTALYEGVRYGGKE